MLRNLIKEIHSINVVILIIRQLLMINLNSVYTKKRQFFEYKRKSQSYLMICSI